MPTPTRPLEPNDLQRLLRAPLCRGLSPETVEALGLAGRRLAFGKGEVLIREGRPADAMYLVLSGRLKLTQTSESGQSVVLRLVGPGETLALISVLERSVFPVTAAALASGAAIRWPGPVFHDWLEREPRLALNALPAVLGRLHEVQERYRELATERVERRIARGLLRLVRQTGERVEGGVRIGMPLTRQDLAEMTGTTLFTVSRVLSRWEQDGLLTTVKRRIVIRRGHALVALAEELPETGD